MNPTTVLTTERATLQCLRENELKPRKLLVFEKQGEEHSVITDLRKCRIHRMSVKTLCENVFQEKENVIQEKKEKM